MTMRRWFVTLLHDFLTCAMAICFTSKLPNNLEECEATMALSWSWHEHDFKARLCLRSLRRWQREEKKRKSEGITREIVTSGAGSRFLSLNYYYSRLFSHSLSLLSDDLRVINFNLRIIPSVALRLNATLVPDERSQRFRLNEAWQSSPERKKLVYPHARRHIRSNVGFGTKLQVICTF